MDLVGIGKGEGRIECLLCIVTMNVGSVGVSSRY